MGGVLRDSDMGVCEPGTSILDLTKLKAPGNSKQGHGFQFICESCGEEIPEPGQLPQERPGGAHAAMVCRTGRQALRDDAGRFVEVQAHPQQPLRAGGAVQRERAHQRAGCRSARPDSCARGVSRGPAGAGAEVLADAAAVLEQAQHLYGNHGRLNMAVPRAMPAEGTQAKPAGSNPGSTNPQRLRATESWGALSCGRASRVSRASAPAPRTP